MFWIDRVNWTESAAKLDFSNERVGHSSEDGDNIDGSKVIGGDSNDLRQDSAAGHSSVSGWNGR